MTQKTGKTVQSGNSAVERRPARPENRPLPAKPSASSKPAARKKPVVNNAPEETQKPKRKISKFTKGLIIWLVVLTIAICIGLIWFNGFLGKYEELYQESLPYHQAESTLQLFADQDLDSIWTMMADKPKLTEFENESSVKKYMKSLIKGKEFTYKQTEDYSESAPEYYICSGEYIIAKLKLAEDETQNPKYGFKAWKPGNIEFYTVADHKLKVTLPEKYTLTVNGKEVAADYMTEQGIEPEENKYLQPYAELPKQCVYEVAGLYAEPKIKVKDADGKEVKAEKNKTTGEYVVNPRAECPDKAEVEKYAISFTKDFANYISQDAGNYALDKYFPKNSKTLRDIKRNSSREWYTRHGKVDIKNEQIKDFICYTKDIVYVEAYVEQHMEMFWGTKEREVVKTTAHLYLYRINGSWKIAGIRY